MLGPRAKQYRKWSLLFIIAAAAAAALLNWLPTSSQSRQPLLAFLVIGEQTTHGPPWIAALKTAGVERGVEVIVLDGKFDSARQSKQLEDLIAMMPDVVLLQARDSGAMVPALKKAFAAGLPVGLVNNVPTKEGEANSVFYAGPNGFTEGAHAADLMHEALHGKGNVVMILGAPGQQGSVDREQGFEARLRDLESEIVIIDRRPAGWVRDIAANVMTDFIAQYGNTIDGVFALDDPMALGAWTALSNAGHAKGAKAIVGINGDKLALAAVNDGTMYGTVMQSAAAEAIQAFAVAMKVLEQHVKPPMRLEPYFNYMDTPKVTKSNVQKFLSDGP